MLAFREIPPFSEKKIARCAHSHVFGLSEIPGQGFFNRRESFRLFVTLAVFFLIPGEVFSDGCSPL